MIVKQIQSHFLKGDKKKMNKNLTEVVFIIDESGSMHGLEKDAIGGFNSLLLKQKKEEGECLLSTVLFNTINKTLHDRVYLENIKELEEKDYNPSGCTALLDALGETINKITNIHKYIREEDVPAKTIFIITTDGMENASTKYTKKDIKQMIECQKEKGWEFIYLAANIDAVSSAKEYGINEDFCADYICDKAGSAVVYECMSKAISSVRKDKKVGKTWKQEAQEDFIKRRK